MVNGRLPGWEGRSDSAVFGEHMAAHAHSSRCLVRRRPVAARRCCRPTPSRARSACRRSSSTSTRSASLKARFVQSNPNGSVVQGTLYVRRPGRMRFEYDAPSQLKIVADGYQVTMWDNATRDFGQWPIGWTAASFLVKDPLVAVGRPAGREARAGQRPAGSDHEPGAQAAGRQGDRPSCGKSVAAARLDHHRQPRQPRHRLAVRTCRPACSWPIRCSRTKVAADAASFAL